MGYWLFLFIISLLIPFTMIGLGFIFVKNPPRTINDLYGYRTTMSMKNHDTWNFAHQYAGKLWFRWGLFLLLPTIIAMCFLIGKDKNTIADISIIIYFIQLVPLVGAIFPTERALRKIFDKNGIRK